jgi:hypothetical protein
MAGHAIKVAVIAAKTPSTTTKYDFLTTSFIRRLHTKDWQATIACVKFRRHQRFEHRQDTYHPISPSKI